MLICPQCQFENPDQNKFCQSCGTSLTHKVCPKCAANVAFNEKNCLNCGTQTGTVWWAIISSDGTYPVPQYGAYLDTQQRYQLIEPLIPAPGGVTTEVQVRVLDCQPFQLSPLKADAAAHTTLSIPAIAKAYLDLLQSYPTFPDIHDAWQQEGIQVVLIENRSDWPDFIHLWHDDKTTLSAIVPWLYHMTRIWAALERWHCRQSLLEFSNLRVDADNVLRLQRLYADAAKPLGLPDLGRLWQRLFHESQRTQFGSLVRLLDDLKADKIQTIDDVQLRLQQIDNELKVVNSAPVSTEITTQPNGAPTVLQLNKPQNSQNQVDDVAVVLPMQLVSLEDAGATDVGRQRQQNEDYYGIEINIGKEEYPLGIDVAARGVYILCDGMGGHAGGEVASTLAVKTLKEYFETSWQAQQLPDEDTIREAVRLANQAIYDQNQQNARSGVGRMGTTLVLVLIQNTKVAVAHVGDSRLYRFNRQRGLEQVTVDHEVGQREISRGVEPAIAYARPDAYQLTQALGPRDENFVIPDVKFLELNEDSLFILASDGLCDNDLLEQHWQTHVEPLLSPQASLERGVNDLIELANQYNGHDNITAIAIRAIVQPQQEHS